MARHSETHSASTAATAKTRHEKAAERSAAIVSAALAEFSEKGFAATRMEDVARRAGVAKGTIYLHFKDKQALFEGILLQVITPTIAELEHSAAAGESTRTLLRGLLPLIRDIGSSPRGDVIRLLISEGARFPELTETHYKVVVKRGLATLKKIAQRAVDRGEMRSDALVRFPQLLSAPLLMGIIWTSLFGRFQSLDIEAMYEAYIDLLFQDGPRPGDASL
jgi:AcrR family transcriptional regulator